MRGDDPLALADVRALDALALAVDTKAEAMGFARPDRQVPPGQLAPYIEFLDQLPEFRDDQERRARERANPPAPVQGEGPQARVAELIRDLDQVAARQWGQPGGVILGESPIVKDLIAEGDAAVEPLIQDFRFDDRLTRSVGFHRDFFRNRHILRADQAAYTALTGILKTTNFASPDPNEPGRRPISREDARQSDPGVLGKEPGDPRRRALVSDPGRRRGRRRGLAGGGGEYHPARERPDRPRRRAVRRDRDDPGQAG